ncbi:MAG: NAD(P)-dependent oxidoreductase [Kofleriaceae bacterium]
MRVLVTGSAGHLGEALMRRLGGVGLDVLPSAYTTIVGSITDRAVVARAMEGCDAVIHAATLHKPHVATHSRQQFIDVNLTGTLNLLEEAAARSVRAFVFTSTTSTFGDALTPAVGAPAAWIDETVVPVPKNIYGVTKVAAEDLCELAARNQKLPVVVLRTSRFFPEEDDNAEMRLDQWNAKTNELLYRRVELEDIVDAHVLAVEKARGFRTYIISATSPFTREDLPLLRMDAAAVVRRHVPDFEALYAARGWQMFPSIDRVYRNDRARAELGWAPKIDFATAVTRLGNGQDWRSELAISVGAKGYHR